MENKEHFYGWKVITGAFVIMTMPFAVIFLAHSIFLKPVTEALGFSATQFSMVFTIVAITTAISSPLVGRLLNKYNIKYIMAVSGAIVSIAFGAFGLADQLWQFYVLSAIVGISATGITQMPISRVVTNWFPSKKKGVATGIAFAGGNVGSLFTILIVTQLIPRIGYQKCYLILGSIMLVVTVLVSLLVIQSKPSDKGQLPYGVEDDKGTHVSSGGDKIEGYTLKEAMHTDIFWIFTGAIILLGMVFAGVQMHIPSYMQSIGHSAGFSSVVTSIVSITGIVSNIFIGALLEKAGLKNGMLIIGIFMVLAITFLLFGRASVMAVLFALLFGMFAAIAAMGPSYLTSEMFGKKDYGAVLGIVMMFFQFGGAIGPVISGFIFDTTGEYYFTWVIFIILLVITFSTFLTAIVIANKKKVTG